MDKLFEAEEGLFQVVRPCTDNGVWKKGLEVYGSRKDCEAYIRLESPGYLHPKFKVEPYNEVFKEITGIDAEKEMAKE